MYFSDKLQSVESGFNQMYPPSTVSNISGKLTKLDCEFCGKSFGKRWNLISHQRIHTGEKQFQCDICLKTFSWKGNLRRHRFLTHSKREEPDIWTV